MEFLLQSQFIWTIIFIGFLILIKVLWKRKETSLPDPPGPNRLPLIGNLLILLRGGGQTHETFTQLARQYGPIYQLSVCGVNVVLLNDWSIIYEAFVKRADDFNHKPTNTLPAQINKNTGLISSNGILWKDHRRFTLKWLRNLGLGKQSMTQSINLEIAELLTMIQTFNGKPFDPQPLLSPSILNVIWSMVAGQRFTFEDTRLQQHLNILQENIRISVQSGPLNFLPWLRYVPLLGDSFWKLQRNYSKMCSFLQTIIDEHKENLEVDDCNDLIKQYLRYSSQQSDVNTTFTEHQLRRVISDLFLAGTETTVTTLRWCLLLLMDNPQVQQRVALEVDDVIGRNRCPTPEDRYRMPYTEATLAEVQRYSSIVPFVAHAVDEDTQLRGFRIRKDSVVLGNLWAVMRSEELWKQPNKFWVERFLDSEGKLSIPEFFIPFSIGKRACLGESLAKTELFLFLTSLLQRFTFRKPDGATFSLRHIPGVTLAPREFQVIAEPR